MWSVCATACWRSGGMQHCLPRQSLHGQALPCPGHVLCCPNNGPQYPQEGPGLCSDMLAAKNYYADQKEIIHVAMDRDCGHLSVIVCWGTKLSSFSSYSLLFNTPRSLIKMNVLHTRVPQEYRRISDQMFTGVVPHGLLSKFFDYYLNLYISALHVVSAVASTGSLCSHDAQK